MASAKKRTKTPAKRGARSVRTRRARTAGRPNPARAGAADADDGPSPRPAGGTATRAVRVQPLIAVRDVISSSRWYCALLDGRNLATGSDHDDVYDRVYCDEEVVLQLHSWDDEEHPNLVAPEHAVHGHGVLLWFEVADFDAAVARARSLEAEILEEPHVNPGPRHRELWLRDLDGYVVVLASPDGEVEVEVESPSHPR